MSAHVTAMHAHSPASYSLSLMIHGAIAAAILLSAYLFNDARNRNNDVFEVVGGFGNNWNATEAPALGSPDAAITLPTPPVPPQPVPVPEAPPVPVPTQTPVTPIPHDAVVVPSPKPKTKQPPIKPAVTPTQSTSKTMSIDEFNKLYGAKNKNMPTNKLPVKTPTAAITATHIATPGKGLLAGVDGATGSAPGANGNALTAAERDQMDAYFATLAEHIKQAHVKPEGVSMELVTRVEYYVGADGIIGAVKILKSSGNRAFDDSVQKAFRSVRGIGPRPDGRSGSKIADFRMKEE